MAEDLTDNWWNGNDEKEEVEEVERIEEKENGEKTKKKRKKRKFDQIVDSNVMSSEDQVKEQLGELLGNF